MEFAQQLKSIRQKEGLTQAELADRLHVTRQAVSSWERGISLPDLGTLITISQTFNLSLDQLILGGELMNKTTQQLINDGNQGRRTRLQVIYGGLGLMSMVLGFFALVIKAMSVEYIDADGILHENFFLVPIGFLFIFLGLIFVIISLIQVLLARKEKKRAA